MIVFILQFLRQLSLIANDRYNPRKVQPSLVAPYIDFTGVPHIEILYQGLLHRIDAIVMLYLNFIF
jgi:hypothetical protein